MGVHIKNVACALMAFQNEAPVISKNREGHGYKYADLPSILSIIKPLLSKHGLVLTQLLGERDGKITVLTSLIHVESGEYLDSTVAHPVDANESSNLSKQGKPMMSSVQLAGSISTYLRRYAISSLLSIATEDDMDGSIGRLQQNAQQTVITKEQSIELSGMFEEAGDINEKAFFEWISDHFRQRIKTIHEIPYIGFDFVKQKIRDRIESKSMPAKDKFNWADELYRLARNRWGDDTDAVDLNLSDFAHQNGVDIRNLDNEKAEMLAKRLETLIESGN